MKASSTLESQIEVPPHTLSYANFDIGEAYLSDWTKFQMFQYKSHVHTPVTRAYSMANSPGEKGMIKLNVRIASVRARRRRVALHPENRKALEAMTQFAVDQKMVPRRYATEELFTVN